VNAVETKIAALNMLTVVEGIHQNSAKMGLRAHFALCANQDGLVQVIES
jgi:hypothetical protein